MKKAGLKTLDVAALWRGLTRPDPSGTDRVVRGGSWNATVSQIRVTRRKGAAVDAFSNDYGFRCAGEPAPAGP